MKSTHLPRAQHFLYSDRNFERVDVERIARLPGNVALIKKQAGFDSAATESRFIDELMAQARGLKLVGAAQFGFATIARDIKKIEKTLAAIESDKPAFIQKIKDRITPYSPNGIAINLNGYIIAGGSSSGFAFGTNEFYLNLGHYSDELEAATLTTAHELYHAVQGVAASAAGLRDKRGFDEKIFSSLTDNSARTAYAINSFLHNLLVEGAALYVGDPALMTGDGRMAKFERSRLQQQLARLDRLATQLDVSLIAFTSDQSMEYGRVYALGFHGPDQPLYYLGYAMIQGIVVKSGAAKIAGLITSSGCDFMNYYLRIATEDAELPQIGGPTKRLARQHCPSGN